MHELIYLTYAYVLYDQILRRFCYVCMLAWCYIVVITEKLSKEATKIVDNNKDVTVQDHHGTDNAG